MPRVPALLSCGVAAFVACSPFGLDYLTGGADPGPGGGEGGTFMGGGSGGAGGGAMIDVSPGDGPLSDRQSSTDSAADRGPSGTEDCTNGADDDMDGLPDCADPECTSKGFGCAAVGSFAVTPGGACPAGTLGKRVIFLADAPAATCNCAVADRTLDDDCAAKTYYWLFYSDTACQAAIGYVSPTPTRTSFVANPSAASSKLGPAGAVVPPGPIPGQVVPSDREEVGVCVAAGKTGPQVGCAEGNSCRLAPSPQVRRCVAAPGAAACPAGTRRRVASGVVDSRTCSCGGVALCKGRVQLYDSSSKPVGTVEEPCAAIPTLNGQMQLVPEARGLASQGITGSAVPLEEAAYCCEGP